MILVTGASGRIGTHAMRFLVAQGSATRALVRDPSRAPECTEVVVGDFEQPETLDAAMENVETLLLITSSKPSHELALIDSAMRQGVQHIVKITNHKATLDSPVDRRRDHARSEAYLRSTGIPFTLLAPNLLMQNLLMLAPTIRSSQGFAMSTGNGRFGMVDARDVASTAAVIATNPEAHVDRTYLLTGPALLTYSDVADALTDVLGKSIEYRKIESDEHRAAMIRSGLPESEATSNAKVFNLIAAGDAEWISDSVTSITGKKPRTLHSFIADHKDAFVE